MYPMSSMIGRIASVNARGQAMQLDLFDVNRGKQADSNGPCAGREQDSSLRASIPLTF